MLGFGLRHMRSASLLGTAMVSTKWVPGAPAERAAGGEAWGTYMISTSQLPLAGFGQCLPLPPSFYLPHPISPGPAGLLGAGCLGLLTHSPAQDGQFAYVLVF